MKMTDADERALDVLDRLVQDLGSITEDDAIGLQNYLRARLAADQQKANIPDLSNWAQHYSVNETAVQALRLILGDQQKGGVDIECSDMGAYTDYSFPQQKGGGGFVRSDGATQCACCGGWNLPDCPPCCDTPQPSIPAPAQRADEVHADALRIIERDWFDYVDASHDAQQPDIATALEGWRSAVNDATELATNAPDDRYLNRASRVVTWIKANKPEGRAKQPAVVGDGVPLRVFSAGRWTYDGTGQTFSHEDMDAAAFVVYRDHAALTPAATPGEQPVTPCPHASEDECDCPTPGMDDEQALDGLALRMANTYPMAAIIRALDKHAPGIRHAFAPPKSVTEGVDGV